MKSKTLFIAALASVFALGAAAPSFAAGDANKKHNHINRMIKHADANRDGRVSHGEMTAALAASFAVLDTNRDGVLSKAEIENRRATYKAYRQQVKAERKSGERVTGVVKLKGLEKHFAKIDSNGDGVISRNEVATVADQLFKRRDRNSDGYLSKSDFNKA